MAQNVFLKALFNDDEYACFADSVYGVRSYPVTALMEPVFIGLNPLRIGAARSDKNCAAYRNFLLELDVLCIEEQRNYLDSLQVPYTTLTYSGGKSLHAVICLADSLISNEQYQHFSVWLHRAVPKADHTTKNPSRLTRFPGVLRPGTDKIQQLMYVGARVAIQTFKSWLASKAEEPISPRGIIAIPVPNIGLRGRLRRATLARIAGDWKVGNRNNALFTAACDFAEQGYSFHESKERLSTRFPFSSGFTEREFENTLRSAYARFQ